MGQTEWLAYLSERDRLRFRVTYDKAGVTETCVQLECEIEGQYHPVVRYDTAHGFAHCDKLHPDGRADNRSLALSAHDLATYAQRWLAREWQVERRRYEQELAQWKQRRP